MSYLDDVINDINLQKNKNVREAQKSYVEHFGYQYYKDLLTYEIFDDTNAFDIQSVENSYVKLLNRSVKKDSRVVPEDISNKVFGIPKTAKQ